MPLCLKSPPQVPHSQAALTSDAISRPLSVALDCGPPYATQPRRAALSIRTKGLLADVFGFAALLFLLALLIL